jgi:hypothetical protein
MPTKAIIVLVFLPWLASTANAQPSGPIVAVFNIEAKGVKFGRRALSNLSDYLAARLAATGNFQVVPRAELRKRLRQQKKKSYKACYDHNCQVELGRELAAQKSLATSVMKMGRNLCVLTSTIYDLKRAATERGATAEGPCTRKGIMESIKSVVRQLTHEEKQQEQQTSAGPTRVETKGASHTLPADFDPGNFDALGFYERARTLARQKMSDAFLIDFDVEGVYPDGHVDLTIQKDYRANFRFRSPSRSRGNPDLPANVEQDIECLVYVEVSAEHVEVYAATSMENCQEKPRPRWRCSLGEAWTLARKEGAPLGNVVAKVSWLWDGWYFDFGQTSLSVPDGCK